LGVEYLRHYDRVLAQFRNMKMNLIEIGVSGAVSVRVGAQKPLR
jgi:hypothetical protein